jgi:hypothetical protein
VDSKFNVKEIYTKVDREDYISGIPTTDQPNTKAKAPKPWQFNNVSTPSTTTQPTAKPNPKNRDRLIPRTCQLKIKNPKLNLLYHELQSLPLIKFTNVAAIAFRSFVENSMDCYIEENKLTHTKSGLPLDKNSKFLIKVTEVANHLEINKLADKHICKGIKSAASNPNDLLGIETLHAYVHNAKFAAIPTNMIITWDNIQPFIEKVWGNIK